MTKLLIIKTGHTFTDLQTVAGDFDLWIQRGTGLPDTETTVVEVYRDEPLPSVSAFHGVIVSGSSAMVTERVAWSERTADWLRAVMAAERPLLGICYGHQLIAHALGGEVAYNPRGYEAGTIQVHLHPEATTDRLFQGLPNPLAAYAVHAQTVLKLPPQAVCLSHSAQDQHQAFRVGECCWGVQFHPEFDSHIMRHYLQERSTVLRQHQQDPNALLTQVRDCPHSVQILRRFAAMLLE